MRAHQRLLKVVDLFARLGESRHDSVLQTRADEVFARLDPLLARSSQLTARAGDFLDGRSRD